MEHPKSKFQFKGYTITRSLIECRKRDELPEELFIAFSPKGIIDRKKGAFQLSLGVTVADESKSFRIEIDATADYIFEKKTALDELDTFFYVNAPALLFPHIRAYISTLTNLSGFPPITLPTLNTTALGAELRDHTHSLSKD